MTKSIFDLKKDQAVAKEVASSLKEGFSEIKEKLDQLIQIQLHQARSIDSQKKDQ